MGNWLLWGLLFGFIYLFVFALITNSMDEAINSDYKLKFSESMMSRIYSDEQMAEYNKEKEKAIAEAKSKANMYLIILEVGLTAVYLDVLPLEKKKF